MQTIELKGDGSRGPGLGPSVLGMAVIVLALLVLGHLWGALQGTRFANAWTLGGAAILTGTGAMFCRRPLARWLVSVPFSVALLGAILVAAALGTLVVQGYPPDAFAAKYPSTGGLLRLAGLDDIFHSFTFRGLLALLTLSLVLVVLEKRAWRPSGWSFALNHGGVIVILVGGLIGTLSGTKGFIDLHEGQVARQFAAWDRFGRPSGATVALDFGLKLDKFEVERVPLEFRFYVYRKENNAWTPEESCGLADSMEWRKAGSSGRSYRLVTAYPDFDLRQELRDVPAGGGHPALQVQSFDNAGSTKVEVLLAGVEGRDALEFKERRARLRFAWDESQVHVSTEALPARHVLRVRLGGTAEHEEEIAVEPGRTYTVAGGVELTALEYYPDIVFDSVTKLASTGSAEPNNPALRISVHQPAGRVQEGYVFAGVKGHSETTIGNVVLTYRYEPARSPADREVVLIGSTREVLDYRKGVLKDRVPFAGKKGEAIAKGIPALFQRLSASAEEVQTALTVSTSWRRPVAEVEIRSGSDVQKHFLKGAMPFDLGNGDEVLVFQPKPEEIKAFRSRVSILKGDGRILQDEIAVNHPLSYGGYRFYQSNYRSEDLTYSGILVVKDPGLGTVYVGFVLICLGAICRFYLNPWLQGRRGERPGESRSAA